MHQTHTLHISLHPLTHPMHPSPPHTHTHTQVYNSSEVGVHLPSHAYTFTTVDNEWRELMTTVARNTAVISLCLRDGESINKKHTLTAFKYSKSYSYVRISNGIQSTLCTSTGGSYTLLLNLLAKAL